MKAHHLLKTIGFLCVFVALFGLLAAGCSTTKKVDWNSRVGSYTYDQAVAEMGPPDKQAKLADGKTVAEWIARRAGGGGLSIGTGVYGSHTGVGVSQSIGSGGGDRVTRLTFGSDGKLTSWLKN
jgi:hypothetical protein